MYSKDVEFINGLLNMKTRSVNLLAQSTHFNVVNELSTLIVICHLTWCCALRRGRVLYQLTLSLWRLVCLCCCAEARLEVLKLTKHLEDGTIKARWRFRGLPFHSLVLHFYQKDKAHLYRFVRLCLCLQSHCTSAAFATVSDWAFVAVVIWLLFTPCVCWVCCRIRDLFKGKYAIFMRVQLTTGYKVQ